MDVNTFDEKEEVKSFPVKWIKTSWKDQGEVCFFNDRIWYTEILDSGEIVRNSILLKEWEEIPEKDRIFKEEEHEIVGRKRNVRVRKENIRIGNGSVERRRSTRFVRNKRRNVKKTP